MRTEAMQMQTNPEMFSRNLPVHTVTHIDHTTGMVTLSGSDGSSYEVPLTNWGPIKDAQPLVGSKIQFVP
jgi:hypothetical protein